MVSVNYSLLTGPVPINNSVLTGTVPVNNYLLTGTISTSKFGAPDPSKMFTLLVRTLMSRNFANPITGGWAIRFQRWYYFAFLPLVCRIYSAELVNFVCVFKNEGSLSIRNYWQGPSLSITPSFLFMCLICIGECVPLRDVILDMNIKTSVCFFIMNYPVHTKAYCVIILKWNLIVPQ